MNDFKFCPMCGSRNIQTLMNGRKWLCPDCGFDLYNNTASAVGIIIHNSGNEVLFEVRAKEPRKGYLALPGGFTNADESAEQAAERECMEETGLSIKNLTYVCSFPNDYEYKNIHYKTCDLFFSAGMPEQMQLKAQETEVQSFVWKKIKTEDDIQNLPLAFSSAKKSLLCWLQKNA
ncbi:NUDIX domain-containing protein [Treponema rectale]|uniref:NADH pyrophosphatase NudC (Nudix superfamily) n=1 Tax=Treponema rectale TaxID=744512 RepID=A0A840SGF1_9SPIR|nr:NUDIX domain-containing protein [Treponema rectale]MBB5219984.1 NADH pyrophosphatase NudC (nudix superfamily) [Treponema rectale]QOS40695.1 NUDIX domain-containing protein [Treponema rectale]